MKERQHFVHGVVQGLYSNLDPETSFILLKQKLTQKQGETKDE